MVSDSLFQIVFWQVGFIVQTVFGYSTRVSDFILNLDSEETKKELNEKLAVAQFVEVMPQVLTELNKDSIIGFGTPKELNCEGIFPDFVLTNYAISFTIGKPYKEKAKNLSSNQFFTIETYKEKGIDIDVIHNKIYNSKIIDLKLDYKTKEEWKEIMKFIFEKFF